MVTIIQAFDRGQMTHCEVLSEKAGDTEVAKTLTLISKDFNRPELVGALKGAMAAQPEANTPGNGRMFQVKSGGYRVVVMEREVHDLAPRE